MEVFKSFYSEEEAKQYIGLLAENNIDCIIEKSRVQLDKLIIGNDSLPDIHLKLNPVDFSKANKVINEAIEKNLTVLETDYYLFSFTDEELVDVVHKPDEWSNQDVILAKNILNERGINISNDEMAVYRTERIKELEKPASEKAEKLTRSYIIAVVFAPIGIFYNAYMLTSRKILPDGRTVWVYNDKSRSHYRIALAISIFITIIGLVGAMRKSLELV